MKTTDLLYPLLILLVLLNGCGGSDTSSGNQTISFPIHEDNALRQLIEEYQLNGNPMRGKILPDISNTSTQLGRDLFFSKVLSGNRDTACASCHHPLLGGGDNLSLPIGVEASIPDLLGPGRFHSTSGHSYDTGPTVPRNAPTTFNIAAWNKVMFHDGRIEATGHNRFRTPDTPIGTIDPDAGTNLIHAQARFPVTSPEEMKGFSFQEFSNDDIRYFLAARLGGYDKDIPAIDYPDYWLQRFRAAFNQPAAQARNIITEQNISFLLGEYQRSQHFSNTPWRAYINGNNDALSNSAKQGALLFYRPVNEGGANCVSCHQGDFFTDEAFHNIAMPQMGRGKGDGIDGSEDFGRFRETGQNADRYAFRTPTLLNVEITGPWGHAGSYTSLAGVIRHHLNPAAALSTYDYTQLTQPGIQNLDKLYTHTLQAIESPNHVDNQLYLSPAQISNLIAFMKTLTDPCVKSRACLSPWIADSKTDTDPNGDQLNAQGL